VLLGCCRVWTAGSPVRTTLLRLIVKGASGDRGNDFVVCWEAGGEALVDERGN
jgi:hypothetical protein